MLKLFTAFFKSISIALIYILVEQISLINSIRADSQTSTMTSSPAIRSSIKTLLDGTTLRRAHFEFIDSTQTRWKELCQSKKPVPPQPNEITFEALFSEKEKLQDNTLYLISAGVQSSSYGQHGRVYHSVPNNLFATYAITWPDYAKPAKLMNIPMIVGLSTCEMMQSFGLSPQLKWVNDLLLAGQKTGGILCETCYHPISKQTIVLMGIGLNVNMEAEIAQERYRNTSDPLKLPFTSMKIASNHTHNTNHIATDPITYDLEEVYTLLSTRLAQNVFRLRDRDNFTAFLPSVLSLLAYKDHPVTHEDTEGTITRGVFIGVTADGFAQLLLPTGEVKVEMTGRIRPLRSSSASSSEYYYSSDEETNNQRNEL